MQNQILDKKAKTGVFSYLKTCCTFLVSVFEDQQRSGEDNRNVPQCWDITLPLCVCVCVTIPEVIKQLSNKKHSYREGICGSTYISCCVSQTECPVQNKTIYM